VRLKLISCEIFYREMCATVARSSHQVDVEFLPKGLHDIGSQGMCERMQAAVDCVDESQYDAILLGYALCNNGLVGLTARSLPLVLPRAHDCITMFLGSKERYLAYFNDRPGVYFKTTGWIERNTTGELHQLSIQHKTGLDMTYEELVEKYGEDNAKFLHEQLGEGVKNYGQLTFIEMGVEPDDRFERHTQELAASRGWAYEKLIGDISLFERLVNGEWREPEFLVIQPGQQIAASFDDGIVKAETGD
jgi:hypothetical protein